MTLIGDGKPRKLMEYRLERTSRNAISVYRDISGHESYRFTIVMEDSQAFAKPTTIALDFADCRLMLRAMREIKENKIPIVGQSITDVLYEVN